MSTKRVTFSHVGLNCQDQITTARFYTQHFGFTQSRIIPLGEEQIIFLKSGDIYLELFQAKGNPMNQLYQNDGPPYIGVRHIAFQVDDVEAKLKEMGSDVKITLGPLNFDDFIKGWKAVWIMDPDGRIVEISQGYKD